MTDQPCLRLHAELNTGTLRTAVLINAILFAKLLGTMPPRFIGCAILRATDHTRLHSWVVTLSQLLCELKLQNSSWSVGVAWQIACAAGCSMTADIVNLEGKLHLLAHHMHSPADSSCTGKFESVLLTRVCM